jgi:hypothetical protein
VTSQKDQIQALIAEIDGVLQKTTPRLPWVMSGEVTQQRQMLERVRNYLVAQQRRSAIQEGGQGTARTDLLAHDIYYQSPQATSANSSQSADQREMNAQQMLERVIQEMGYLRANLMQPLQAELEALHQQREYLRQEVQQLEAQRQSYGATQPQANQQQMIAEFLHILMGRLQETLPQQVAQSLKTANSEFSYRGNPALVGSESALVSPSDLYHQSLEQLQLQSGSDQLVVKLDSTLKLVFESLERNVQAYQESLAQGLEQMHNLGQQGEMMFTGLVNHLAQQLGRETTAALQSVGQPVEPDAKQKPEQLLPASNLSELSQVSLDGDLSSFKLPYPGAELPLQDVSPTTQAIEPAADNSSIETAIDAWLQSVGAPESNDQFEALGLENLEMPDLNLTELELSQVEAGDINALLNLNPAAIADATSPNPTPVSTVSVGPTDQPFTDPSLFPSSEEEDTAEIDAALKLLEELSLELPAASADLSLEDTEAEIDRMLSSTQLAGDETESEQIFDDAQNELAEFYELFGRDAIPADLVEDSEPTGTWQSSPTLIEPAVPPSASETGTEMLPYAGTEARIAVDPIATDAIVADPIADPIAADPTVGWDVLQHPHTETPEAQSLLFEEARSDLPDLQKAELLPLAETEASAQVSEPASGRADEISSLAELLAETTLDEQTRSELAAMVPPATDATTQELFDQTLGWNSPQAPPSEPELEQSNQPAEPAIDATSLTEQYTLASPEEDLLPLQGADSDLDSGLWLDDATLSRLNEDLSNLEQDDDAPEQFAASRPTDEPDLTLADWALKEPQTAAAAQPPSQHEELSLEELAASLQQDDSDLTTPSPAVETEDLLEPPASEAAFTLEGLDDLFADIPSALPSVNSVPPPASAEQPAIFTLEGMDDLFGDLSAAPSVNPVAPPGSSSSDKTAPQQDVTPNPPATTAPTAPTAADPAQPAAFTLEGMDDLFADVPSKTAPEPAAQPPVSNSSSTFTLADAEDLFADVPTPTAPVFSQPAGFTLEGLDDLFVDAPVAADMSPVIAETPDSATQPQADFTFEQVDDLFMEVPAQKNSEVPAAGLEHQAEPPAAFTLEQVGDLFVEVPSEDAFSPELANSQITDDLTVENFLDEPLSTPQNPDDLTLEQAFESLMGLLDPSSPPAELPDLESPASPGTSADFTSQTSEKKKEAH